MKLAITAAVAATICAGAAQAATVDLTYTIDAVVTYYGFIDGGFDYEAPGAVGDIEQFVFTLPVDMATTSGQIPTPTEYTGASSYSQFDAETGAIDFYLMTSADTFSAFNLTPRGEEDDYIFANPIGQAGQEYRAFEQFGFSPLVFSDIRYDVTSWSVDGLPEIAPVPLPASLPLLFVGMAGIGWAARRRVS